MSQLENQITTTFRARAGNLVAEMGNLGQSIGRVGGTINENTRASERWANQMKAFSTTLRYAFAGSVIFGITRMVSQVKDLNVQLGQMQALSDIGSGLRYSTNDINDLFKNLQTTAVNTITPLSQVNDAAINFLSTVQDVNKNDLPKMLEQIGQGAKLAQTPFDVLTQSATTMQIAFQRAVNPTTVGQFTRMWARLIGIAPGGIAAAPAIAGALPGLASMFQMAPGRNVRPAVAQAQMMALTQGVLQTGMPANTAMRGLTYLIQSVAMPTGKARGALASIGITPQWTAQHGVTAAVLRLLGHIAPVSKARAGQLGQIPDEQLTEGMNLPGISGQQMTMLRAMVPRIHGERAAIILASQLQHHGKVDSLLQDIQHMINVQDEQSKEAHQVAQAWTDLRDRSKLADVANAVKTMQLEIAQAFAPVTGFVVGKTVSPVANLLRHHQTATRYGAYGGALFLGLMGLSRLTGVGRLGNLLGGTSGAAAQRFEQMNAVRTLASGATGLGSNPLEPMFVTIVGPPLIGPATAGPTGGKGGLINDAENAAKGIGIWSLLKGAGRRGLGVLNAGKAVIGEAPGLTTLAGTATFAAAWAMAQKGEAGGIKWSPTGRPYAKIGHSLMALPVKQEHLLELQRAQKFFGGDVSGISGYHTGVDVRGRAELYMTIEHKDANGKISTQKVHVPIDMWQGGRAPSSKAKTPVRTK